ncbi:hypothetical protein JZ751_024515 [Albula glossodonta]|uniref:Uncharacterized protein n=1 Tax=Albula glossodonta TaxID=121402 RepID=A0A8T2PFW3_9TELE|nr:hypothetical protein JZ751_024515 [Albula glossodonta]
MGRKKIQISRILDQRNRQTLRRKGLGLDGAELDSEEAMQVAAEKYQQLNEGLDLSVTRQRYYAPPLLPAEAQYLVSAGCENGFPVGGPPNTGLGSHRNPAFKAIGPKLGPASPHTLSTLIPPNSGIGYSMFSHGNLSRALEMKTPPPLNLGCDSRRAAEVHPGLPGARTSVSAAPRVLYQGMHSGNHMMAMGKAGLLGHSLGEYGLSSAGPPEYPHPSFSHSMNLQRNSASSWQPSQHQEAHMSHSSQG